MKHVTEAQRGHTPPTIGLSVERPQGAEQGAGHSLKALRPCCWWEWGQGPKPDLAFCLPWFEWSCSSVSGQMDRAGRVRRRLTEGM